MGSVQTTTTRLAALGVAALLVLTGCAQSAADPDADAAASESAAAEASASAAAEARAEQQAEQAAAAEAEWEACQRVTADLYEALDQVDSRLDIGLSYDELGDRLGDVQVAYNDLDFDDMEPKCTLNIGIALEDALNEYVKSLRRWRRCIDDYSCQVEGAVLRQLRKHWSDASERLEHVDEVLASPEDYAAAEDWL